MKKIVDFDAILDDDLEDDITFTPEDHSYISTIDGKEYISTTTLLKHYSLSPSEYDQVPESILRAKAAYGTKVHAALEEFIKGDSSQLVVTEVQSFNDWLTASGLSVLDCISEQVVFNREYGVAGTVDFQAWNVIGDFKTTASLHTVSVMWQLSIYNYLLHPDEVTYNQYELKVFWFQSTGELIVKDIPLIPYNTLLDMLEAYKRGDIIWVDSTVPTDLSDKVDALIKQRQLVTTVKGNLRQLENEEEILKEAIKEQMKQQQRIYVQAPTGVVTISEYTTSRYDTKKIDALLTQHNLLKKDFVNTSEITKLNVKRLTK